MKNKKLIILNITLYEAYNKNNNKIINKINMNYYKDFINLKLFNQLIFQNYEFKKNKNC
jgi:hypothetical protein